MKLWNNHRSAHHFSSTYKLNPIIHKLYLLQLGFKNTYILNGGESRHGPVNFISVKNSGKWYQSNATSILLVISSFLVPSSILYIVHRITIRALTHVENFNFTGYVHTLDMLKVSGQVLRLFVRVKKKKLNDTLYEEESRVECWCTVDAENIRTRLVENFRHLQLL